jgi:hypothetical protein
VQRGQPVGYQILMRRKVVVGQRFPVRLALQKGNIIVLAFKRRPVRLRWDELRERARTLEACYGLEFLRFLEAMKRLNPHTDKRLLI